MIPMFPNFLGTQNDQTVQTLLCVFWQTFNGHAPPAGETVNRRLGPQGLAEYRFVHRFLFFLKKKA